MVMKSDVQRLVRQLERAGWRCKRGSKQHIKCHSPPSGKQTIILASTPSRTGFIQDSRRVQKALQEG